jgi:hypothetical protein
MFPLIRAPEKREDYFWNTPNKGFLVQPASYAKLPSECAVKSRLFTSKYVRVCCRERFTNGNGTSTAAPQGIAFAYHATCSQKMLQFLG